MNLFDLREFNFEMDKIISFEDNEFIFSNKEYEKGDYKRYFYKYNIENNYTYRINNEGITTVEAAYYNNYIFNNYLYTNSYTVKDDVTKINMYQVNLMDGDIDELYSVPKDVSIIFLSERYALLRGSNYEMDDEHSDFQKNIQGEYDYAILCDLKEKVEYEIKDKRVILGIRDYFIPYTVDGIVHIVFEESYMDDWELEEMFEDGIKKEDFYINSYRESINIISLDKFVEAVKESYRIIPFNQIHKTELTAWTRYFGMDSENIYYRTKDFQSKIQNIYSVNKKTLKKQLFKSIQMDASRFSYSKNSIYYDMENRKIYRIKVTDDNEKEVKELLDEDFIFKYSEIREHFNALIDNCIITSFWTEDENGDNYKDFVKIRDINNVTKDIYEGSCIIIKDNIILFKAHENK